MILQHKHAQNESNLIPNEPENKHMGVTPTIKKKKRFDTDLKPKVLGLYAGTRTNQH